LNMVHQKPGRAGRIHVRFWLEWDRGTMNV
jgi:hypothetical protein